MRVVDTVDPRENINTEDLDHGLTYESTRGERNKKYNCCAG